MITYETLNYATVAGPKQVMPGKYSGVNCHPDIFVSHAINFTVTNRLRPNNGSGTWGSGSADVYLKQVTVCYTAASIAYFNQTV